MPDEPTRHEATAEERKAIASLERLAKKWPDSLMLFAAAGSLIVIRSDGSAWEPGAGGTMRQDAPLAKIDISCDGGDPW